MAACGVFFFNPHGFTGIFPVFLSVMTLEESSPAGLITERKEDSCCNSIFLFFIWSIFRGPILVKERGPTIDQKKR